MSIFAVNHLCREVLRDHAFRAAMKSDPAKALAPLDLSDDERRALLAGDVGTLYRMGVNAFLMNYLARFEVCGLNVKIYNQRMRAVKVDVRVGSLWTVTEGLKPGEQVVVEGGDRVRAGQKVRLASSAPAPSETSAPK